MSEFRKLAEKYQWEIDRLEEESRKLKLHIEAKDKAYTALLKDNEEIEITVIDNQIILKKYDYLKKDNVINTLIMVMIWLW